MKTSKVSVRRLAWALLAGTSALLLVVGLSLLLSHSQALAQPGAEAVVASLKMRTEALTPTSQTRSPEKWAVITQKDVLTITGVAWDGVEHPAFPPDPVLDPINNPDGANTYYVVWADVPSALNYTLEESDTPDFSNVTEFWEDVTSPKFIPSRQATGTYYYRLKAHNVDGNSRWSDIESVVVQTLQAFDLSSAPSGASAPVTLAQVTASELVTVQVRIDSGDWETVMVTADPGGWWNWSYVWTLPEEHDTQHIIQTRASDADGIFGSTDTITITLDNQNYATYFPLVFNRWPPVPYAPTLNDIDNADGDRNYTVSWSYDYTDPPVVTYTLQEAMDTNFTNPTNYYPGSSNSQAISDKGGGTYYYRVQGHNTWGAGTWSAVKSTSVCAYHHDFNSPTTVMDPWPIRRTSYWHGDQGSGRVTWTEEHDGTMYIIISDKWDFTIASPLEVAPSLPYVIETRVKVHDPSNLIAYGIIFGGNGGSPCPAYRDTGCLTHYYRLETIWDGGALKAGFKRIDYHEPESSDSRGKGRGADLISYTYVSGDPDGWHTWKFVVKSNGIDIYFDGSLFGSTGDHSYVNEPYFGVYASANEYKPAIGRFDYYYVSPQ